MLKFKSKWREEPLDAFLVEDAYANNGRVYLGLWCSEDGYFEPWADITVNLSGPVTDSSCGFVDTANCPEIGRNPRDTLKLRGSGRGFSEVQT